MRFANWLCACVHMLARVCLRRFPCVCVVFFLGYRRCAALISKHTKHTLYDEAKDVDAASRSNSSIAARAHCGVEITLTFRCVRI